MPEIADRFVEAAPAAFAAFWAGVAALPRDTLVGLACVAGLFLLYQALGAASIASARRRTRAEVSGAWNGLSAHARAAGFSGYGLSYSRSGTTLTLWLWGEAGSYRARGVGPTRAAALAAAFAAILDAIPDDAAADGPEDGGADRPGPPGAAEAPDAWWHEALGLGAGATLAEARAAFRARAKAAHPDRGGSADAMARLNAAWAEARLHLADGALAGKL